jgi:hypothetical protein
VIPDSDRNHSISPVHGDVQLIDDFGQAIFVEYDNDLVALQDEADNHVRVALTEKGREAYRKIAQWISEVVQGRTHER